LAIEMFYKAVKDLPNGVFRRLVGVKKYSGRLCQYQN
jgi:hypothetical protein